MIEDAAKGLTTNRMGLVVQPLRFTCTSTGKMQDLPDSPGPQALESSLALAAISYRKAILALRKVPVQALRQSAYRMVQASQPLQDEPDAIVANWGQLMDRFRSRQPGPDWHLPSSSKLDVYVAGR